MEFLLEDNTLVYIYRFLLAALFGSLIGIEREVHGRAAGLRTHLLVSGGSALFMILSLSVAEMVPPHLRGRMAFADPARIAAQIVTGIGFIGAGTIVKERSNIRGLTTAACLWIAAAIGMTVGAGLYVIAGIATLTSLFSLATLNRFDRFFPKDSYRTLEIHTNIDTSIKELVQAVERKHVTVLNCNLEKQYGAQRQRITLFLRMFTVKRSDEVSKQITYDIERLSVPIYKLLWRG